MSDRVTEFRVEIPQARLDDLGDRLRRTRWPERETVEDRSQRVPLAYLQDLCARGPAGRAADRPRVVAAHGPAPPGRYGADGSDCGTGISTLISQQDPFM